MTRLKDFNEADWLEGELGATCKAMGVGLWEKGRVAMYQRTMAMGSHSQRA